MLDMPVEEIGMDDGKAVAVKAKGETFSTKMVKGDPSYFSDRVRKVGQVVRAMCILDHPVAKMNNVPSGMLVLATNQTGRKSDIHVVVLSGQHGVTPADSYLGFVSTTVGTDDPESELESGLSLL